MSQFKLSARSLKNLQGVNHDLVLVVHRAIKLTEIDFGVVEGLRSVTRQQELVARGASKTMRSKHLTGDAVDLVAYLGNRVSWELSLYDEIADAMRVAARNMGVQLRWGGAWQVANICEWNGTMEAAMTSYIDHCRMRHRRPFLDGPHFQVEGD